MRFNDKVIIITGAGRGIGRGSAILFAKEGAKVVVLDIHEKWGHETVRAIKENNGEAVFVKTDVTKAADIQDMVKKVVETYGRIDVLYNNVGRAGVHPYTSLYKSILETSEEEWDWIFDANLKASFLVSKYVIPEMIKVGGGCIINTSSDVAFTTFPGITAYTAAKIGVIGLTRAMAQDLAKYNIRVNCVAPSAIRAPDDQVPEDLYPLDLPNRSEKIEEGWKRLVEYVNPLKRWGTPEDIARAALYLASDEARMVTGTVLNVDAGAHISKPYMWAGAAWGPEAKSKDEG